MRTATTTDDALAIAVDGESIAGTLVTPGTLIPGVLFVHGWGGSQQQYVERAREVAALGCICLTFDLRGHAGTMARFPAVTREDNLRDVVAAYDTLTRQRAVDAAAIAVVGSSYGGYLAAILTSLRRVTWLALRAPALYEDTHWTLPKGQLRAHQMLDAFRQRPVGPGESRALAACAGFTGNALIVESEHDAIVPAQAIANYRASFAGAASLTCRVLEGADHGLADTAHQQAYTRTLVHWLREMIHGARADARASAIVAEVPAGGAAAP